VNSIREELLFYISSNVCLSSNIHELFCFVNCYPDVYDRFIVSIRSQLISDYRCP